MEYLKQSTAATVKLGPFVDDTDGKTAETGLTIAQASIRLSKNGGAFAQTNNAAGATHDENGYYGVPLDTTDTGTLGRVRVAISVAGALPVWADFLVVPAMIYDSLVLGTDTFDAQVTGMGAGVVTAAAIADAAIDFATFAADCKTGSGLKANVESVTADAITAAAIANGAIDAATFAAGAIDAAAIANAAIDAATFAAGAIDAAAIANGAIDAATFAAGAIDAAAIATGAIDADAIADNAIDAGAIATGAITAAKFAAGAIDAAAIANAAIDAATFAAGAIDAAAIANGAIDNATLAADVRVKLDLTQAIAHTGADVAADTVGRALQLARGQAKGKWSISGDTLTLYDVDNTTSLAAFALTPASGPYTAREAVAE